MKRNLPLLPAVLLILGLTTLPLPNALAQESGSDKSASTKPADVKAALSEALKTFSPDATLSSFKKTRSAGTNAIYSIQFTVNGTNMVGEATGDGILLMTDGRADIETFPDSARYAVRKAITSMGTKDLGVTLTRTYAKVEEQGAGGFTIVKLPAPEITYGASVQNNHGVKGKYRFDANGSLVEKPSWAQ